MAEFETKPVEENGTPSLEDLLESTAPEVQAETLQEDDEILAPVESTEESEILSQEKSNNSRTRKRGNSSPRYKNEITLRGSIAKMVEASKVTVITLGVKSTMTITNYPTIMFFGDTREQVSRFKEGDRVYVTATLQSYDESKLRKGQSPELIIGSSMVSESDAPSRAAESEDELGLKPIENAYCNDENQLEIRGQILGIECNRSNNVVLTIRTVTNGRMSIIKYPYYARNAHYFLKNIHVLDFVRAIGTVQTANIPVESTDESQQVRARIVETATSIRSPEPERRLKTKKKQFYILYDVYPVN